ncbi:hypothetical protein FQN60_001978, partial [Etheostoma spectabile]
MSNKDSEHSRVIAIHALLEDRDPRLLRRIHHTGGDAVVDMAPGTIKLGKGSEQQAVLWSLELSADKPRPVGLVGKATVALMGALPVMHLLLEEEEQDEEEREPQGAGGEAASWRGGATEELCLL